MYPTLQRNGTPVPANDDTEVMIVTDPQQPQPTQPAQPTKAPQPVAPAQPAQPKQVCTNDCLLLLLGRYSILTIHAGSRSACLRSIPVG